MNLLDSDDLRAKLTHQWRVLSRHLDVIRRTSAFSARENLTSISRVYVINLDRKPNRWKAVRSELSRFRTRENQNLTALTRRFSAVDARYMSGPPKLDVLTPTFTLAEQLTVHPDPLLTIDDSSRAHTIAMTKPEIAIALSHIEVWKLVASGEAEFVLVLEDDVMMRPRFARRLDREWRALRAQNVELAYLSYRDVSGLSRLDPKSIHRQTDPGLWEASGYVLSRGGAQKLLNALPANGPIDLWMNFQFGRLRTFATSTQLIEQRLAEPSTNSYSVLPVLSQVGSITREKALVPKGHRMRGPVVALGSEGSGLTALAVALSTLGYSVASDLAALPDGELSNLRRNGRGKAFDAFVNVAALDEDLLAKVMANRTARLIVTDQRGGLPTVSDRRVLRLPPESADKWDVLSRFLNIDYPSYPYPDDPDVGQRQPGSSRRAIVAKTFTDLQWDRSPWILPQSERMGGLDLASSTTLSAEVDRWHGGKPLSAEAWFVREDTFPSNLAIFRSSNFTLDDVIELTLKAEKSLVREFSAAAIAARTPLLYGSYCASIKPARGSGVITGMFLHRSNPRQEIDIEFLGGDTTKMLVNVFFNPGAMGTKLEYGYRGTPTEIDLGFDAADEFHNYEIEWRSEIIKWKVDGTVVYERKPWDPTPIPDRPLEFNVNIWTSRSVEFAGTLEARVLPATTTVRDISLFS